MTSTADHRDSGAEPILTRAAQQSSAPSSAGRIEREVQKVIDGKNHVITAALTVLLAEGHLLVEDVPGVGKTQLARALAAAIGGTVHRIQFTPDLLPSDITGVSIYDQTTREFEFKPGPIFSNIVIADEINRASPKTQSALLECMEEGQVTVDGTTYPLPKPFLVVATQNPIDMEGTYALPEAQRDRFMARLAIGYPDEDAELHMVQARERRAPLESVERALDDDALLALIDRVHEVRTHELVERYAVALSRATRTHPRVKVGASPRATLQLIRAAKAAAIIDGRSWLAPDDVKRLARVVLPHRLVMNDGVFGIDQALAAVEDVLAQVIAPRVR
ncbi:AAA family ATPase [Humidisolicoccus flavus]|uniref:AAA family ATPase n=1 Tax=Humidisolicoccus flavus TaxID=3111414 RepID=UPI00324FB268